MSASPRSKAIGALVLLGLLGAMCAAILVSGSTPATATEHSLPASKSAVAIDRLIELSTAANDDDGTLGSSTTGWVDVLSTQIKTSQQKDLLFDAALQCGLLTDTTVASKGGEKSTSTARASMAVRILLDKGTPAARIAEPTESQDATDATVPGVVYCDRLQKLEGTFGGYDCTADLTTGEVTCAEEESLRLLLQTMNANAFNFAADDVGSGIHTVTVQAKADASAIVDEGDGTDGSLAGAEAFAGAGSLVVEEVRLVKGAQIVEP